MKGFPELTPVQKICNTSVDDARGSISRSQDIDMLKRCLTYEKNNYNRATMLDILSARIRRLEAQQK